MGQKFSIN